MKVFCHGFCDVFGPPNETDFYTRAPFVTSRAAAVFLKLLSNVFQEEVQYGSLDESDLLIESVFSKDTCLDKKNWKCTFLWSGESNFNLFHKRYTYVLGASPTTGCYVSFPFFLLCATERNWVERMESFPPVTVIPPKDIVVIVSNGGCWERNMFLHHISQAFKVDFAGGYRTNVPQLQHPFCSDAFNAFVSQYKVIITMENVSKEEYITEKILHGMVNGTVPVYWGAPNVTEYFNEDRFIRLPDMSTQSIAVALGQIKNVLEDSQAWLSMVNQPIFTKGRLKRTLAHVANDIKQVIHQPLGSNTPQHK